MDDTEHKGLVGKFPVHHKKGKDTKGHVDDNDHITHTKAWEDMLYHDADTVDARRREIVWGDEQNVGQRIKRAKGRDD